MNTSPLTPKVKLTRIMLTQPAHHHTDFSTPAYQNTFFIEQVRVINGVGACAATITLGGKVIASVRLDGQYPADLTRFGHPYSLRVDDSGYPVRILGIRVPPITHFGVALSEEQPPGAFVALQGALLHTVIYDGGMTGQETEEPRQLEY